MTSQRAVIVGGGVSGLATAFYLGRAGIRSTLIEKSGQLGGLIRTDVREGCRLEAGPDSFIATKPAVSTLAGELGLADQLIGSNDAARRVFIVRRNRLVPLPAGMSMMVPGQLLPALRSPLFSTKTKARFLRERFERPRRRPSDFSVGELVGDHFGSEVLQAVADPLLAGVYGGSSAQLSAPSVLPRFVALEARYGSLIEGVRREPVISSHPASLFLSFRDGMQTLTDALTEQVRQYASVRHESALSIRRADDDWLVQLADGEVRCQHLVLACPPWANAQLLLGAAPELSAELRSIPSSSAILVTLVFDAADVQHPLDGFGFLVPEMERITLAACTWINTKFPGRIPAGLVAMRAFIVAGEADRLADTADAEVVGLVTHDIRRFMKVTTGPRFTSVSRWPNAMPQYVVGHGARMERVREVLVRHPTLHLVGNAYDGVGVPDCVRLAKETADAIFRN